MPQFLPQLPRHRSRTAALRKLCEERDLELIVEGTYASSGYFSLQHPESFEPVLRFPLEFHIGYSSFVEGIGDEVLAGVATRLEETPGCTRARGS